MNILKQNKRHWAWNKAPKYEASGNFNGKKFRKEERSLHTQKTDKMREIVHMQAGQCGNQIGAKVSASLNHHGRFYN